MRDSALFRKKPVSTRLLSALLALACTQALGAESEPIWRYTVKPGDNLINLGKTHLVRPSDWKQVQHLNHVKNPYKMPYGMVLKVPLALIKQQPASAEVLAVTGQVHLQKMNGVEPLSIGQKLAVGAKIITLANSKVSIRFADGSITHVYSNAILTLDSLSLYSGGAMVDTKLRLQQGQIETHANPAGVKGNRMQITTPTAIAAVRGTLFRVDAKADAVMQETLDGRVAFESSGQDVDVSKGFGSVAEQGQPPIVPVPLLPAVSTKDFPRVIRQLPFQFEIPSQVGAVSWQAKIAADNAQTKIFAETELNEPSLLIPALDDGDYFLSLRAKDQHGIAGYDAVHAFTLNAQPLAPNLVLPPDGAVVRDAQPELRWSASQGANAYALEVATDSAFHALVTKHRLQSTSVKIASPLAPGKYYWRVAAITTQAGQPDDQGPFATQGQFAYQSLPPAPDISQLRVKVENNRVFVTTIAPLAGMTYQVRLSNPFNHQTSVWMGNHLQQQFDFPLKEYGAQELFIRHVDADGVAGPEALYAFDAFSRW
jgi:hypothetical protein